MKNVNKEGCLEFVKYTNIAIYQYNKLNEKDAKIFNEIKNYTFIEEQINHIFNIWKIAFNFYTKNIKDLLKKIC